MVKKCMQDEINHTEKLIVTCDLNLPSYLDLEKSSFVKKEIVECSTLPKRPLRYSSFTTELDKVTKGLSFYFSDEVLNKYRKIILKPEFILKSDNYEQCRAIFTNCETIPSHLLIPKYLDTLSFVDIGYEVINILKQNNNPEEIKDYFTYREVIPMLYELLQRKNKAELTKEEIVQRRLRYLKSIYNQINNEDNILELSSNNEQLYYYQLPLNVYFISFYYTLLLHALYRKYPQDLLIGIEKVLKQQLTTKELLQYFELHNQNKEDTFTSELKLLLTKR